MRFITFTTLSVGLIILFVFSQSGCDNGNDCLDGGCRNEMDSAGWRFDPSDKNMHSRILMEHYYARYRYEPEADLLKNLKRGRISDYDELFRMEGKRIGWDWRILAAQAYVESRFNNELVSMAGARGLMQIMPSTADAYEIDAETLVDPKVCIRLAADILKTTENVIARYVEDPIERQIITIAGYNSGVAHIVDAIALAEKYGKNPKVWRANLEMALLMKSDEQYCNDTVVKYGYFRGRQTLTYVRHVSDVFEVIKRYVD